MNTQDFYIAKSYDLVEYGSETSGVPLSEALRFHLTATLARFFNQPLDPDQLTVRLNCLFDEREGSGKIKRIGDECLLTCGIFAKRLERLGGTGPYVGLGRTAYIQAGLTEAAYGFHLMLDVLRHISGRPEGVEAVALALQGSASAENKLKDQGILIFRK
ncbi:hypothetical protein [Pseudosulfitobacter pseudonitzschiae]|uniref:hypothetical protein n=1 Tax=Pseudosulfitobacter pseudonitzschiae TaxID=1402135 RepID=UPI003B7FCD36